MVKRTTIQISFDLWRYLNESRTDPKETFEDIIWGFIRLNDIEKEDNGKTNK